MMKSWLRFLVLLCALFLLLLPYLEADAQRRGGGRSGGTGGGHRPNVSRHGPAGHGSVHHAHHRGGSRRGYNRGYAAGAHHAHHEAHEYYEDRRRARIGAAVTVAAFRALTCTPTTVYVNGVSYYRCGNDWYNRQAQGTSVTYVVVTTPPGY